MRPSRLAEGSGGGQRSLRMEAAFVRVIDASLTLDRRLDNVLLAIDDATLPGVVRTPLDEDDSLVVAIQDVVSPQTMVPVRDDTGKNPKMGG